MSEFYDDYKEWLSTFKLIRETESSEEVEYDSFGNPIEENNEENDNEISVYGILEERRAAFVEIGDRSKSESFKTFICDIYDTLGDPIELKYTDKIKDPSDDKIYRILDINKLLQHHYECQVQIVEVS